MFFFAGLHTISNRVGCGSLSNFPTHFVVVSEAVAIPSSDVAKHQAQPRFAVEIFPGLEFWSINEREIEGRDHSAVEWEDVAGRRARLPQLVVFHEGCGEQRCKPHRHESSIPGVEEAAASTGGLEDHGDTDSGEETRPCGCNWPQKPKQYGRAVPPLRICAKKRVRMCSELVPVGRIDEIGRPGLCCDNAAEARHTRSPQDRSRQRSSACPRPGRHPVLAEVCCGFSAAQEVGPQCSPCIFSS